MHVHKQFPSFNMDILTTAGFSLQMCDHLSIDARGQATLLNLHWAVNPLKMLITLQAFGPSSKLFAVLKFFVEM